MWTSYTTFYSYRTSSYDGQICHIRCICTRMTDSITLSESYICVHFTKDIFQKKSAPYGHPPISFKFLSDLPLCGHSFKFLSDLPLRGHAFKFLQVHLMADILVLIESRWETFFTTKASTFSIYGVIPSCAAKNPTKWGLTSELVQVLKSLRSKLASETLLRDSETYKFYTF